MPDVVKKAIVSNQQPTDGKAIVSGAGLKGNRSLSAFSSISPTVIKGQPVSVIEARLDARLDEVRYYSGDSPS